MLTSIRSIDPIFAIGVGLAAALVRIRREENERGKTLQDTMNSVRHRFDLAWNGGTARQITVKD